MSSTEIYKETKTERLIRFGRNINILGAVALGGLAVALPGPNIILGTLAGINAVQAGGFEFARHYSNSRRKKK